MRYLLIISLMFLTGCATDTYMSVERNEEGKVTKVHQAQRFWRYLPGIGKSKSQAGEASSEVDSSALPDVDFTKED